MSGRIEDLTGISVLSESGKKYMLKGIIGNGSQGVVYEDESEKYVIKFYYPTDSELLDSELLERVSFIKDIEVPKNFVAILDIISSPYVGYVMEKVTDHKPLNHYLIPDKHKEFIEWYNEGFGLRERILIGYIIAKAFSELERNNYSYCDISGNNILVNTTKNASIKLIDVDNIYVAGRGNAAILGTPRYIAPEVVSRQKNPDVLSDNYSLAVILFEMLRVGHPYISDDVLDGTPEMEDEALAGKYPYVIEENSTNMLPEDLVLTDKLKELFRKCFVDGQKNRIRRPSAYEFEKALLEASNSVIKCPSCGAWHYPVESGADLGKCPWCGDASKPEAKLEFYDMLYDGNDYKLKADERLCKPISTYIIRNGKNFVKSLYILRYDDATKERRTVGNYFSIANSKEGYYAYNEFSKKGLLYRKAQSDEYKEIPYGKAVKLGNGDELFFEIEGIGNVEIECGGAQYSFIRKARFVEVSK
jgi:serine/threonine protein kinase